jgi:hypothetical protein
MQGIQKRFRSAASGAKALFIFWRLTAGLKPRTSGSRPTEILGQRQTKSEDCPVWLRQTGRYKFKSNSGGATRCGLCGVIELARGLLL